MNNNNINTMGNCVKSISNTHYEKIINIIYLTVDGILNGEYLILDKKEKLMSKSF
ncbi:hypothetical protein D3C83_252270 [compost metagenome]